MKEKVQIGLIGCGRISKNHLGAISQLSDRFELNAVCDVDESALQTLDVPTTVSKYRDIQNMLEQETLDLVSICTPSGLHAHHSLIAAKHGVNVLCEKPMSTKYGDALNMISAFQDQNLNLFIVKQNRLNPTLLMLKRAIDANRFGRIHLVQSNVFWTRPQEYYDSGSGWRGTWKMDGGALMNQASHYADLLVWLFGSVSKVHAFTTTKRNIEAEDTGVVNLQWNTGLLGTLSVSMLTYPKNLEGSLTVMGEFGTARIGGIALNKIERWEFSDEQPYDLEIESVNYNTDSVYGSGHLAYYENVYNVLRKNASADTDGNEGIKSLELITAIYRSARDMQIVGMPLDL